MRPPNCEMAILLARISLVPTQIGHRSQDNLPGSDGRDVSSLSDAESLTVRRTWKVVREDIKGRQGDLRRFSKMYMRLYAICDCTVLCLDRSFMLSYSFLLLSERLKRPSTTDFLIRLQNAGFLVRYST